MKRTILAIGAHPDDIEIGCGGTLALLKSRGYGLIHLIVTSGEEGDRSQTKEYVARTREAEAKCSGQSLGASEIIFLREKDGLTSYSIELKIRLISLIRKFRPDIVFTHAQADHFPDHSIVHQLTMSAITGSSGPWYPEAKGHPHRVKQVYGYEVWNPISKPQLSLDITNTIGQKIEALQFHQSQLAVVNYIEAVKSLAKYRGVMTMTGEYAEVYEVIRSGDFS